MPEFAPGEAKAAIAPITVKPAGLSCEAEIFLGPDEATKVATSGRIPFTSTGASKDVHLPIAMPAAEGTYHVYVDVYAEGLLIAAYQAIEDVVIAVLVAKGMITLYATGLRTFYWPGGLRMEGTPYEQYIPPGVYADWDAEWYYPPWRYNEDEYMWVITQNDPCTPPEPIDLNNLLIKVHDYWSDEICPATGYGGACEWGPFGPFVVKDGGIYTIDIRTGVLTEGNLPSPPAPPAPFDPWSYDFNGNGVIDTEELLAASNDYNAGIITKEQLDQVTALWEAAPPPPPPPECATQAQKDQAAADWQAGLITTQELLHIQNLPLCT